MDRGLLWGLALLFAAEGAAGQSSSLAGTLLVADRELSDPRFAASVVLMVRHQADGALGLVINRPSQYTVGEILPESAGSRLAGVPVYWGGPVEPRRLALLSRRDRGGLRLAEDLYLIVRAESFDAAIATNPPAREVRIIAGYAGWAPGQLEHEVERGDWHIVPATAGEVFGAGLPELWRRLIDRVDPPRAPQAV